MKAEATELKRELKLVSREASAFHPMARVVLIDNAINIAWSLSQSETQQPAQSETSDKTEVDSILKTLSTNNTPPCQCHREDLKQRPYCDIHDGPEVNFNETKSTLLKTVQSLSQQSTALEADVKELLFMLIKINDNLRAYRKKEHPFPLSSITEADKLIQKHTR